MKPLLVIAAGFLLVIASVSRVAAFQDEQRPAPLGEFPEPDHPFAVLEAARQAQAAGEHARARELILVAIERALPLLAQHEEPSHLCLCAIGHFAHDAGELRGAERFRRAVVELSERTLPADHIELQRARGNLAVTMGSSGDLHGARALQEAVLEVTSRTLPADHPGLLAARGNLAVTMRDLGDLHGARELQEAVLETLGRIRPADHPELQTARGNLAATLRFLGDLQGARALFEQVLEANSRTLPPDHPALHAVRASLASLMHDLGDLHGARTLQEAVLEFRSRTLPADHPELQAVRGNLAVVMGALGDLQGARALAEAVLEVNSRTLPDDHASLQFARGNLAVTLRSLGDLHGAQALFEQVLEVSSRTLPADHPALQTARMNLAATMYDQGDLQGARALEEAVLEVRSRTLPDEHPDLQSARGNLARTLRHLGDLHGARALEEAVLGVNSRTLPADHPELQRARGNLSQTLARLAATAVGSEDNKAEAELEWSRALVLAAQVAGAARRAAGTALWTASLREAEERIARGMEWQLAQVLAFAGGLGLFEPTEALFAEAFELSEATRAAGLAAAALARWEIEPAAGERLRAEIRTAGEELAQLAQRGATREEYHRARALREAAEKELLALAREQAREGLGVLDVGVAALAQVLGPDRALVGFRRYRRWWIQEAGAPEEGEQTQFEWSDRESLGTFVLRSVEGRPRLAFVDLGVVAELESLVGEWRDAIRATPERGLGVERRDEDQALAIGQRLRAAVWDPLVQHLGDTERVVVALDDVLHLVPLDALPLEEEGELIGDRWRLETRIALWELLDAARPASERIALVSLGGASFNSEPRDLQEQDLAALEAEEESLAAVTGPRSVALLRGGAWERGFAPLGYTRTEARGIAELFAEAFEGRFGGEVPALVLDRARASRAALVEAAPRARFLHVATHGWFAPESVRSWADGDDSTRSAALAQRLSGEDTLRGMSPMLLCGLALAGANLPADAVGRVPGLVTAEEISTLDLTGCELAVLSACDTNVGERRAGQGVASLQKALHMAGARSVITSLWKVPDEATSELMLDFYRRLWVEQKPKHQALWEAKLRLRNARDERGEPLYTVRDWAAWVLTGDPD